MRTARRQPDKISTERTHARRRVTRWILATAIVAGASGAMASKQSADPILVEERVQEKKRIGGSTPVYPPLASMARLEGVVRIQMVVTREGTVKDIEVLSGHPLLQQAAINAALTFRYSPTLKDGMPVEIRTGARISFFFSPGGAEGRLNRQREEVRKHPANTEARQQLARYLFENGMLDEAEKEYREVITVKPTNASAHFGLSGVLVEKGDVQQALVEQKAGIQFAPSDTYIGNHYMELARLLERVGAFDAAFDAYRQGIRRDSNHPGLRTGLAGVLLGRGQVDEAIIEYRAALKQNDAWAPPHFALGKALEQKGDLEGALKEYRAAAKSAGSEAAYREAYERLSKQIGKK